MGFKVEVKLELVCDIGKWDSSITECKNNLLDETPDDYNKSESFGYGEVEPLQWAVDNGWYLQSETSFNPTWGEGYCLCPEHNTLENRKRCREA